MCACLADSVNTGEAVIAAAAAFVGKLRDPDQACACACVRACGPAYVRARMLACVHACVRAAFMRVRACLAITEAAGVNVAVALVVLALGC